MLHEVGLDSWVTFDGRTLSQVSQAHQLNVGTEVHDLAGQALVSYPWHAAPAWNFAVQIRGVKAWTLTHPSLMSTINPMASPQGAYFPRHAHGALRYGNLSIRTREGQHVAPPSRTVTMRPGDAIYFPTWVLHTTQNLPDPPSAGASSGSADGDNVLVTYRGFSPVECILTHLGATLTTVGMRVHNRGLGSVVDSMLVGAGLRSAVLTKWR